MRKKRAPKKRAKLGLVDLWVVLPVVALVVVGVWLVFDASYAKAADASWTGGDPWYFAKKQIVSALVGFLAMYIVSRVRVTTISKWTIPLLVVSMILLVAVLIPGIGYRVNGATRWIRLPGTNLQPSEIAKLAVVLYLAGFLSQGKRLVQNIDSNWLPPALIVGFIVALIFKSRISGRRWRLCLPVSLCSSRQAQGNGTWERSSPPADCLPRLPSNSSLTVWTAFECGWSPGSIDMATATRSCIR